MSWDPAEYGDLWAWSYDETTAHLADDAAAAVRFLTERLDPGSRVLELGVGTGRIAIPLAAAGMRVVGVDASPRMLAAMAAKPGGDQVTAVLGDMVDPPVEGAFAAVLVVFNTLFALPSQDAQVACVTRAARSLEPGGTLIVDAAVPRPDLIQEAAAQGGDQRPDQVVLEVSNHDPVAQTVSSARVLISAERGMRTLPLRMRYAFRSEVDLMARLAGLVLHERHADFACTPFDRDSTRHVSVYRRNG